MVDDGTDLDRIKCEIEAQEKLIRNQKAYKLSDKEVKQTEKALKSYKKELEEFMKGGM